MINADVQSVSTFPFQGYPASQLSARRLAVLDEFDAAMDTGAAPRHAIETFLKSFTSMGPWDSFKDWFAHGGTKQDVLVAVARCHVASFEEGQCFFAGGDDRDSVNVDSLTVLRELNPDVRSAILASPTLGANQQIHFFLPGTSLCVPLGTACLGDGDGALTRAEAVGVLTQGVEDAGPLLAQFIASERSSRFLTVWRDLLERARHENGWKEAMTPENVERVGFVCEHIASQAESSALGALWYRHAAEAFCEADSHENAARAFVNAASVFSGAHDEKSAKTASRNAGYAFTRQFDEMDGGQTDRGIRVLRDAFNAFDYAGAYDSALWTGMTLHRHLCDGGQAEAAAEVARQIAAVMRRNGLPGQAVGWEAMGAEPSNAGQVARNE
ncbi:hypothetical protein FP568_03070 [Pandoraea pnomenusa]|uniref:hypothetical protein n=1 Tax=Pandoraea pnomenusa TaxID=93220 RepID=UPI0011989473|nr:hypothetical protein [Pandoraea pnomenusa]QDX20336.1 hypothetical protein FP568_03070 [Pandoraea pnomenusa]